jgi:peptidoglycan/LPS O-acetylase OafA/YrhL
MNHSRRQLKVAAFWCSSLVLLGGAVLFWLYSGSGHSVIQIWKHLIAAVLFTGLLAITICDDGDRGLGRVLSHRWLRACGKYSYCLYIIHPVVVSAARRTGWIGTRSMLGFATYCGMVLGVSFLIAFVSWRFLESPMLRLKSRFAYASR